MGTASVTIDSGTLALIVGFINVLGVIWVGGIKYARIELKTNTMWNFIMAGAKVEARLRGVVESHSPLQLNRDVVRQFGELGRRIRTWYLENNLRNKSDSELSLLIITKFGDALVEQICFPLKLNMGSALIAAVQLCREENDRA